MRFANASATLTNDVESYDTGLFLIAVAHEVRVNGFNKEQTAQAACRHYIANRDEGFEFDTEDYILAAKALGWLNGKEIFSSAFEMDLHARVQRSTLGVRDLKLVCYAIKLYNEVKDVISGTHIGSVGDKLKGLRITVTSCEWADLGWGPTFKVNAVTPEGNNIFFFHKEAQKGDLVISGTVKGHNEFKGIKSTTLNRVKVGA